MLAGLVLRRWTPLSIAGRPASAGAGAVLLLAGLGLAAAGVAAIVRHRTTIVPHHAVSTLVTSGAYRLSRNPMR
ncbi:MAG: hypothetical protein E6I76_05255 [Chloroflexi bacterium]|nr:MAG: hypothetical protein E6I76_05255 [Chloroflexota bacterium]